MTELGLPRPIKPIKLPIDYHVQCAVCEKVEGNRVSNNRLTIGTGTWANNYRARGWNFVSNAWRCPEC